AAQVPTVDHGEERIDHVQARDRAEDIGALSVEPLHQGDADQLIEPDRSRGRGVHGKVDGEVVIGDVPGRRGRADVIAGKSDEVRDHEYSGEPLRAPYLSIG